MRVLLVTDAFPPEIRSSSHLMYELAEDLCAAGHTVTVLTCAPRYNLATSPPVRSPGGKVSKEPNNIKVVRVATPRIHNVGNWRRGLAELTLPLLFYRTGHGLARPDVILCYTPPLPLAWAAQRLAQRWHVPLILNVQDFFPQTAIDLGTLRNSVLIALYQRLEQFLYERSHALAVHSAGNDAWLRARGVPAGKIHVLPNWVDTARLQPQAASRSNPFRVRLDPGCRFVALFAGVMGHAQDMEVIVEAAAQLRNEPGLAFVLVGDGVARPGIERRIQDLSLTNIHLWPFVPRDEYPALAQAADAGLVTLRKELRTPVVPSKLLSYMAAARPVILSVPEESDATHIIREAGCGIVAHAGDATELAAAVRRLATDSQLAATLGANGRRYAERHFARPLCVSRYKELLRSLAERQPAAQAADVAHGQEFLRAHQRGIEESRPAVPESTAKHEQVEKL